MKRQTAFLQRESVRAGTSGKPSIQNRNPPPPGPSRGNKVQGPSDETVQEKAARHYGEWDAECDPSKFERRRGGSSRENQVFFPKFYGPTDFRIESSDSLPPSVWDWAKTAYERAFGKKGNL